MRILFYTTGGLISWNIHGIIEPFTEYCQESWRVFYGLPPISLQTGIDHQLLEFTGEARQQGADSTDPWGPEAVPHAASHGFPLESSGVDESQQGSMAIWWESRHEILIDFYRLLFMNNT